jgi:hypothetical protein
MEYWFEEDQVVFRKKRLIIAKAEMRLLKILIEDKMSINHEYMIYLLQLT